MKKIKKVLPMALAATFAFIGPVTSISQNNISYASKAELTYKNTVIKFIKEDSEYRQGDLYNKANDAEKTIYDMSIDYAKELLNNESSTEDQFKAVAQEIFDAKNKIENPSNPLEETGKLRVDLKLQMYPAKELVNKSHVGEYNKKEYDDLSKAYSKALNVYNNVNSKDSELREAKTKLKNAADTFVKESNRKALIIDLENSIKKNEDQIEAAENLLKNYPKTVKKVAGKLNQMIKESKNLIKASNVVLSQLIK